MLPRWMHPHNHNRSAPAQQVSLHLTDPQQPTHLRILLKLRGVGGVGLNVQTDGGARGAGAAAGR